MIQGLGRGTNKMAGFEFLEELEVSGRRLLTDSGGY